MKVLFIGGNGNISWWCVQRALEKGYEVYELNRGQTRKTRRAVQSDVRQIIADVKELSESDIEIPKDLDAVCDFICFDGEQASKRAENFKDRTKQYIAISSEAVYERKSEYLPFTENTPRYEASVDDKYIAGKIAMEDVFTDKAIRDSFPVTIVRPGFTYDTIIQVPVGQNCFTAPQMYKDGYPLLMLGDGENLVAPLHSSDFANAFVELIGRKEAIGETYHIAAKKLITWNEMSGNLLEALGVDRHRIYHIPRETALSMNQFYTKVVNQQHMWHYIFDDSKIQSIATDWKQKISFSDGIKMTVDWLMEEDVRRRINPLCMDKLKQIYADLLDM